ncbi:MAG: 8-oxo-dGTP diphosphatase [Patescibacteria group bacterium]
MKLLTLVIIVQPPRILLGMKKRGFGRGWWNGFGGKVQSGESIESAARRETLEEAGIGTRKLRHAGVLFFYFENDPETHEAHVFVCDEFDGEPIESDEMRPEWFETDKIPYDEMWPADRFWLPLLLEDKSFRGDFFFTRNDELIKHTITVLEDV